MPPNCGRKFDLKFNERHRLPVHRIGELAPGPQVVAPALQVVLSIPSQLPDSGAVRSQAVSFVERHAAALACMQDDAADGRRWNSYVFRCLDMSAFVNLVQVECYATALMACKTTKPRHCLTMRRMPTHCSPGTANPNP